MDEEPPIFLGYVPYKGPAAIPHVGGEFFGAFFLATNVSALGCCCRCFAAMVLLPLAMAGWALCERITDLVVMPI